MRWKSLAIFTLPLIVAGWIHGSLPDPSTPSWSQVKLGAGGQTTELVMQPCGAAMQLARTDTFTPYYRVNGSTWSPLYTSELKGDLTSGTGGAWAIACAPSKPTRLAVINNGNLFVSDGLVPWVKKTSIAQLAGPSAGTGDCVGTGIPNSDPNGGCKYTRQKIAYDPINENVAYVATNNHGIRRTFDNFTTAEDVSSITASTLGPGGAGIAFDPNSGTTTCPSGGGTCTKVIFVGSFSHGVWYTNDAGATWTQIADGSGGTSPLHVWSGRIAPDGAYWATDAAFSWKCVVSAGSCSGGWGKYDLNGSLGGSGYINAAIPNLSLVGNVVFVQSVGGFGETTTNNGTLLNGSGDGCNVPYFQNGGYFCAGGLYGAITVTASTIPWLAGNNGATASGGDADFDPGTGQLCIGNGIGIFCGTVPTTTVTCGAYQCLPGLTMSGNSSVGIEDMVGQDSITPPSGYPLILMSDRPVFQITNSAAYPASYGPVNGGFNYGHQADYAAGTSTVCAWIYFGFPASPNDASGCSNNYGAPGSWTRFAAQASGGTNGGGIAAADANNIIVNTAGGTLACTDNAGTSWDSSHVSGGATRCQGLPASGWGAGKNVCADKITTGTFYAAYISGTTLHIYSTTSASSAWSDVTVTAPGGTQSGEDRLICNPYVAGDLWFASGLHAYSPASFALSHSTDGGIHWTNVTVANGYAGGDITSLEAFGFGAGDAGVPSLWISGYKNGTFFRGRSLDLGQSWLSTSSPDTLDFAISFSGDLTDKNKGFATTGSSGAFCVKFGGHC